MSQEVALEYAAKVMAKREELENLLKSSSDGPLASALLEKLKQYQMENDKQCKLISKLKTRMAEQNAEAQALTDENATISEHMKQVQAAFDRLKKMAESQGMGKEINKLVHESGLNQYLCRKVFQRLYEDAVKRIERRQERVRKAFAEHEHEVDKVTHCLESEFIDTDCAFLRIKPVNGSSTKKKRIVIK